MKRAINSMLNLKLDISEYKTSYIFADILLGNQALNLLYHRGFSEKNNLSMMQ